MKRNIQRAVAYLAAMLQVPLLAIFVWTLELIMEYKEGVYLTNSWLDFAPCRAYHMTMYLAFGAAYLGTLVAVWFLITTAKDTQ